MSWSRVFQIKWYHLLLAFLAIFGVAFFLVWLFLSKDGVSYIVEDETDIVS